MSQTYKEASKGNWHNGTDKTSLDEIKTGCLQRIADASEKMANVSEKLVANYQRLEADEAYYRIKYHEKCEEINNLNRRINGYKGLIAKNKNQKPKEDNWIPISNPPKLGKFGNRIVLGWFPESKMAHEMTYFKKSGWYFDKEQHGTPTHWQDLPEEPIKK